MISATVKRKKITDPRDEALYWRSQSPQERIAALELIRSEYNAWKYGHAQPGFQRILKRVKRP